MLPWEHVAIAYLSFSAYSRLRYGDPPDGWAVLAVLFASLLPDLIDKPLAWYAGVLPSGRSLGHSIFVAVPIVAAALVLDRGSDRRERGAAFAVGYLSHLATDAVPPSPSASVSPESVLWPVRTYEPADDIGDGILEMTLYRLTRGHEALVLLEPDAGVLLGLLFVGAMPVVWLIDGAPGYRETGALLRGVLGVARRYLGAGQP